MHKGKIGAEKTNKQSTYFLKKEWGSGDKFHKGFLRDVGDWVIFYLKWESGQIWIEVWKVKTRIMILWVF